MIHRRVLSSDQPQVRKDLQLLAKKVGPGSSLKLGDSGRAVEVVQQHLRAAGLYSGPINGTFDAATEAAVKALQTASKLTPTGIVGGGTVKALRAINIFVKQGMFETSAKVGQSGKDIKKLELLLSKLGFNTGKVDGVFDNATAKAVVAYKKHDAELKGDSGVVGASAFSELKKTAATFNHQSYSRRDTTELAAHQKLDAQVKAKIAAKGPIAEGADGALVLHIKSALKAAGFGAVLSGGDSYGTYVTAAVKAFQQREGLAVTGKVDGKTWAKLSAKSFVAKDGTSPAQRLRERGGNVLRTEKLLKKLGYKNVVADGLFDVRTQNAVKAFQKKQKMKVTGRVGASTLKRMEKVAKGDTSAFVKRLLNLARSQLGITESPPGSNRQKFSTFFGRPPEAWCADFVSYCYTKSGKPLNFASTSLLLEYFEKNGTFHANNPKPGDIIIYDWTQGDSDRAEHTGLVERVFKKDGKWFMQTIEGNWNSKVSRKVVPLSDVDIRGFGNVK